MRGSIRRWGNSLALRLPKQLAAELNVGEDSPVDLHVEGATLMVTAARPKYRLDELLADFEPEQRHGEVDWGGPAGKESW